MGRVGELRTLYRISKRLLGVPRNRCEFNIKVNLKGPGFDDVGWIYLAYDMNQQEAIVNANELATFGFHKRPEAFSYYSDDSYPWN
jgi:hypothetical protein